jgi:hypothetical protein
MKKPLRSPGTQHQAANALLNFLALALLAAAMLGGCRKDSPVTPPATTTPDTTNHTIVWQPLERLGAAASSSIEDVTIVSDTLTYAVGCIYLKDATGAVDPLCYNLLHWNGRTWAVRREAVREQLTTVCAFSENDVWVAFGHFGEVLHWSGKTWRDPGGAPDGVLCSMKIAAMLSRAKGRDFYDAMILLAQTQPDYDFLSV